MADPNDPEPNRSLAERAAERMAAMKPARASSPPMAQVPSKPPSSGPSPTRIVAAIDQTRLRTAGFVTPRSARTRLGEEFRAIKRPLLGRAFATSRGPNSHDRAIMVTSARQGEGKTFTTINLAMSMASEPDVHVLLVDCDLHGRDLQRTLGIAAEKGLLDVLADEKSSVADVLVATDIDNLSVLPSGWRHPHATELLASRRMAAIVEEILDRYPDRVVLIDTPPVLASSEAGVIAMYAGQAVVVVESGRTGRQALERALAIVGACPGITFVLNRATEDRGEDYFGTYGPADQAGE